MLSGKGITKYDFYLKFKNLYSSMSNPKAK